MASSAGRADVAVLNAALINVDFKLSEVLRASRSVPSGLALQECLLMSVSREQTIQVSTLGITLLGLLLLE